MCVCVSVDAQVMIGALEAAGLDLAVGKKAKKILLSIVNYRSNYQHLLTTLCVEFQRHLTGFTLRGLFNVMLQNLSFNILTVAKNKTDW